MNSRFANRIALWPVIVGSFVASQTPSLGQDPVFTSAGTTSGLVGFWPFNSNVSDESGNANTGTPMDVSLTSEATHALG